MSQIGHNSGIASHPLRNLISRIERLEEEKANISKDIKEVYAEAKGNGFDTKIMRKVVQRRRMERHVRQEMDALLDTYEQALGDLLS